MDLSSLAYLGDTQGKDETFVCNLSSFDAYLVKRMLKAPKPFVFAVKSTDNITMFENPADCVNVFSCEADEGNAWLEKILLARVCFLDS